MSLKDSTLWEKIKWIWSSYVEAKRKAYPLAHMGTKLILFSVPSTPILAVTLSFYLPDGVKLAEMDITSNDISLFTVMLGIVGVGTGLFLIYKDIGNLVRNTSKVLIRGMDASTQRFPDELLSKAERKNTRETVTLSLYETGENDLGKQIKMFNAESQVDVYSRFILSNDCARVYLGGLARVPFLVAYGNCFSSASSKVIYFDKMHRGGDWKLLNKENSEIDFETYDLNLIRPNVNGDIGIAVSFSNEILKSDLPDWIEENTLILKANTGKVDKNLIENQDNLHAIAVKFKSIVDECCIKDGVTKIHLFLSIQSTLALEFGRMYQEGTHRNWVIHQFDGEKRYYPWGIELNKDGITEYVR